MPPSKKSKKKDEEDKKQTSLFSFADKKKKPSQTELKEPLQKTSKKPMKPKVEAKEVLVTENEVMKFKKPKEKVSEKKKTKKSKREIPKELFFQGDNTPFGLKEFDFDIKKIKRESYSSKYLRYLIKAGKIVQDMERGLLLDVDYDGGQNKAFCKFYDLDDEEIKIWIDMTNHEPYCLSDQTIQQLENDVKLTNYEGFKRLEKVKIFDLLKDKDISMTKIYGNTPTDIGGSGTNIRSILGDAWEARIRYHLNYIYDRAIIPGLVYRIKEGKLEKLDFQEDQEQSKKIAKELLDLFKDEQPEIQEFAEKYLDIFLTPIPDIKRMAIDIEVNMGPDDYRIPDPQQAKQEVISISFVATDGFKAVYVLERENFIYTDPHENFPDYAKLVFFKDEKELLLESFRLIWDYPMILTFNGDNFDLNYLFHRARNLKIERDLIPMYVKRGFGFMSKAECYLRKGIHIDLFNFFFNRSISGYAFGGAYETNSLNNISAALLGEGKYVHEEEIHEMDYGVLSWYNLKDSILTLELTKFNNSLVWNLIILLCRITKMPIHDMIRHQISSWIQNIFYYEHRQNNYLLPRREDIKEMKPGGYSKSTIEGKGFQGAYVIPPVPGIHYDVVVMDFASLYPSIIKEYNLSYETVSCPHEDCKDNLIKGIPYHICTHKMGIFAYVVGFFRDIRVNYFKPKSNDASIPQKLRDYYTTIQQALKVFVNGCLPYNEEVIIKTNDNEIHKVKIGDLDNNWDGKKILSIERELPNFGKKKFVDIKGVVKRQNDECMEITLSDGRRIHCTKDYIIPKIIDLKNILEV
ncbi:MAG: hypothetical protein EU548_09355, partial [Promethearchaeota archaeon]